MTTRKDLTMLAYEKEIGISLRGIKRETCHKYTKYRSLITVEKKIYDLGQYENLKDAIDARDNMYNEWYGHNNWWNKPYAKTKHALYATWTNMKSRCLNENTPCYKHYGGRGIKMCDEWLKSFDKFVHDMGDKPENGYTVERLNVNGGYNKNNCVWEALNEQRRNTRVRRDSKSGIKGVYKQANDKYLVKLGTLRIGLFKSITLAKRARKKAELEHWGKIY